MKIANVIILATVKGGGGGISNRVPLAIGYRGGSIHVGVHAFFTSDIDKRGPMSFFTRGGSLVSAVCVSVCLCHFML